MSLDFFDNDNFKLDNLTNVYERQAIISYMEYLIDKKIPFTFAILDIDNFKYVNDTYGHLVGDDALKVAANKLKSVTEEFGVIGRYGGDEFIFVLPEKQEYDEVWQCGHDILKSAIGLSFPSCKQLQISYTIGMSRYPLDSTSIDELISLADKALYRGKIKGRNCFIIYLPEKHKDIDVMNKRDKIYTPLYLNNKIFNILNGATTLDERLREVMSFVGSTLMIDHICLEMDNELKYEYFHPLSKKFGGYLPYGNDLIYNSLQRDRIYYENVTVNKYDSNELKIYKEFKKQGIYSIFLSDLKTRTKHYGFLRAEMVAVDTGRIWQQSDLILLSNLSNLISLILEMDNNG